jgi:hypothetical protein
MWGSKFRQADPLKETYLRFLSHLEVAFTSLLMLNSLGCRQVITTPESSDRQLRGILSDRRHPQAFIVRVFAKVLQS